MRASEVPPTLTFELDWASAEERAEIMAEMQRLGRQTMNLRVMPDSRLLRVRAPEDGNRIVGWAGLDAWYTPRVAEFFSLFVYPEYRTYLVGLILETARCAFLVKECAHIERVLVRMESASNTSLLRYRLGASLMAEASREEVGDETLKLCGRCELYGQSCAQQAFLWVDVRRFLARGSERLGFELRADALPTVVRLDPSRIRKSVRPEANAEAPALRSNPARPVSVRPPSMRPARPSVAPPL